MTVVTGRLFRHVVFGFVLLAARGALAADADVEFDYVAKGTFSESLRKAGDAYHAKRFEEAFGLFQRAACAGDKESQAALSRMYLTGEGVQRDDLEGYAWLKTAAEVTYAPYRSVVTALDEAMTQKQHEIATPLADRMLSQYGRRATRMRCDVFIPKGSHIPAGVLCLPDHEGAREMLRKCVGSEQR